MTDLPRSDAPASDAPGSDTAITPVARALLSVSDKRGLVGFARFLAARGVELLSTGGSARALSEAGLAVKEVADHTGFPELLDGRVKTLHPLIHGGILGRRDVPQHQREMLAQGIAPIDLVVVNLYPFEATVAAGAGFDESVEQIDIGGPALIRAAAKNHDHVAVVTDPEDYASVIAELEARGGLGAALRRRLAHAAYARTAAYDAAIAAWFAGQQGATLPNRLTVAARRRDTLRYGENPHQAAAFYTVTGPDAARAGVATARQIQGKELSYNNINDTDAAFEAVAEFDEPAVVIVKHANPCGVAVADSLATAYARALFCDPVSAYGGIIAVNRSLDAATATAIAGLFAEVVIAPEADADALAALAGRKNLRVLLTGGMPDPAAPGLTLRSTAGGLLVQTRDSGRVSAAALRVATRRAPTPAEQADLLFAFRVAKHVKSNAIVYAKGGATVGIGAGQMSRVDSSRIAAWKAWEAAEAAGESDRDEPRGATASATGSARTLGAVVASDAFFPFADGLLAAVAAGATAVIQPGGSMRDAEVIAAADEHGLAMVFTGMRHFRH